MNICLFGDARSAHIQCLARHLSACGHWVHIVTHKYVEVPGATVERFSVPRPSLSHPYRWHARWERYLLSFLRRFDVVNVHFLLDWGFTPEIMQHGRFVASVWGSDVVVPPGEGEPSPELTATRIAVLRHADAVTTCGPTFAMTVADYAGLPTERVDVVPFGVDLDLFKLPECQEDDEPPWESPRQNVVGFYKGFREVYGADALIRAIPIVLDACPETRFELIGDGPQRAECVALSEELGVASQIDWQPRRPHARMVDALARWRISVIPSIHEAFAVAALESSAMGVPVVASDVGGLRDTVLHGETGLRVPPQSPEAMARAIVELLRDDSKRQRMSRAGRKWVRGLFDWRQVVERWVRQYQQVCEQAPVAT